MNIINTDNKFVVKIIELNELIMKFSYAIVIATTLSRPDEYDIMFSETVIIAIELRDKFVQFCNYVTSRPDGRYVILYPSG